MDLDFCYSGAYHKIESQPYYGKPGGFNPTINTVWRLILELFSSDTTSVISREPAPHSTHL